MVEKIAENILRMGGPYKDKSWVYMRWMVRGYPDLWIFRHFSREDLLVPLTIGTASIAVALGLIDETALPPLWVDEEKAEKAREALTSFAKQLFPRDPAKVDYPLFLLGRWIKGKPLNPITLKEALHLFDHLYKVTGRAHVFYQVMEYYKSGWERRVADTLTKMKIPFRYEGIRFPLPNNIRYTPDFILSESTIHGRKIVLEPHYQMTEEDILKFSLFRQIYGKDYFLILLMRNDDIPYYRTRNLLPDEVYDDVWPIGYVHILLDKIRKGEYTPI